MVYVLIAAVAAGAGIGGVRSLTPSTPDPIAETEPPATGETQAAAAMRETEVSESTESAAIEGEVLEVLQVSKYTYLRLGEKGAEGTWVAVPTASVEVGARARVGEAMKMTGFTSTALKRTFPVIYFGTLESGSPAHEAAPDLDPHAGVVDPSAAGAMNAAHPPLGPVAVKPVDRAPGPSGKTVAELCAQRTALAGKTVRIHATVVKSTPGVLGHTYLHLRDGSGDAALGTHDVAVTTDATPAVGDVVLVEGVVAIDRDIGSGYKFPTLVENAKLLSTP
jgi:hypothetical protein